MGMNKSSMASDIAGNASIQQGTNGYEVLGQVVIEPNQTASFDVGLYEAAIPRPDLQVDFTDGSQVKADLECRPDGAEYRLTYHFRNLRDVRSMATVRMCPNY